MCGVDSSTDLCPFELILINDGSTDSSGQICDHLASQYENIKVYHIENAGVSNARNMGIQLHLLK